MNKLKDSSLTLGSSSDDAIGTPSKGIPSTLYKSTHKRGKDELEGGGGGLSSASMENFHLRQRTATVPQISTIFSYGLLIAACVLAMLWARGMYGHTPPIITTTMLPDGPPHNSAAEVGNNVDEDAPQYHPPAFDYRREDQIRRENYRQEAQLRKANQDEFANQYSRCSALDARKIPIPPSYSQAMCMDGTRPAYFLRPGSGTGASKWLVFFEGGGWCYSLEACKLRAKTDLGSSTLYPECLHRNKIRFYMSADAKKNPVMHNWNLAYVKYCDGGSYGGDSSVPLADASSDPPSSSSLPSAAAGEGASAQQHSTVLHFRGRHNREATIAHLLRNSGMHAASEVVLGGCSAGGLGVFLGLDQMAHQIRSFFAENSTQSQPLVGAGAGAGAGTSAGSGSGSSQGPGAGPGAEAARRQPVIVGFADSGFFMRHTSDNKWKLRKKSGGGAGSDPASNEAIVNGNMDYQAAMRDVYRFMNISSGANPRCIKFAMQNADYDVPGHDSTDCIFPEHLAPVIQTPLFAKQPKYDQWQIWHVVGKPNNVSLVNSFGTDLVSRLKSRLLGNPRHGAFVDSCTHHCTSCSSPGEDSWNGDTIRSTGATRSTKDGWTASDAFAHWVAKERRIQTAPEGSTVADADKGVVFAMQDRQYPCSDCCKCHA